MPDLEKAATWYEEVFGFRRIRSDFAIDRSETPDAPIFEIYPESMKKVNMAWLSAGNGVGFEIFEFQEPKTVVPETSDAEPFHYARGGYFHIAITVADPKETVKKAIELGGKQIGEVMELFGEHVLYATDPWGNVVEILSCSFEQLMGNRG